MSEIVTAVFENGILRPATPLALREHETVRIKVLRPETPEDVEEVFRGLETAGILTSPAGHGRVAPISDAEREIARSLGAAPGKTLSQLIIDERDGR